MVHHNVSTVAQDMDLFVVGFCVYQIWYEKDVGSSSDLFQMEFADEGGKCLQNDAKVACSLIEIHCFIVITDVTASAMGICFHTT